MSVVNFTIPKSLEHRIAEAMRVQGFTTKAEFFRFSAINALQSFHQSSPTIDDEYAWELEKLAATIQKKFKGKKLPSLEEQFADMK